MDIRCEKCQTEYALDDKLIHAGGTPVRCTNCNHVFRAYPQSQKAPDPGVAWTLKTSLDEFVTFESVVPLQEAIRSGRVLPTDSVSRFGGPWKIISTLPELQSFVPKTPSSAPLKPVAAGFPAAPKQMERLDTVRDQKSPFAPSVPSTPGTESTRHSTDSYRTPLATVDSRKPEHPIQPVVFERKTQPPPPMTAPKKDPHQPAPGAAVSRSVPQRNSFESGDTLQMTVPETLANPPAVRRIDSVVIIGDTLHNAPSVQAQSPAPPPAPPVPAVAAAPIPAETQATRQDPDFSQIRPAEAEQWDDGTAPILREPAWTSTSTSIQSSAYDEFDNPAPSRRPLFIGIAIATVILLGGLGYYLYTAKRDEMKNQLGAVVNSKDAERYKKFFMNGKESFLLDTETAWIQADREFNQVLALAPRHPGTLASLAQLYAVWAQYMRDSQIDARSDAGGGDARAEVRAEDYERKFQEKLEEARRWGALALAADSKFPETQLALADIERLQGNLDVARRHLDKAAAASQTPDYMYVKALIAIDERQNTSNALALLDRAVSTPPTLRVLYRMARVQAFRKKYDAARSTLDRVLTLNSEHLFSKTLIARINRNLEIGLYALPSKTPALLSDSVVSDTGTDVADSSAELADASATGDAETSESSSPDAKLSRALKMQENGRTKDAMRLFQDVLDQQPSNVDALTGMGYCQLDIGATGQAIALFRRALNVSPSNGPAIGGMAETYKKMGQKEEALKWYEKYIETNPNGRLAPQARRNIDSIKADLNTSGGGTPEIKDTAAPPPESVPMLEAVPAPAPAPAPEKAAAPAPVLQDAQPAPAPAAP